jgi:hypothetical protein
VKVDQNQVDLMATLLDHFDWHRVGGMPGLFDVWAAADGKSEVVLPLDPARADFARLLAVAEREVSARLGGEGSRYLELLKISEAAALEQTHWQKQTSVSAGLIPWDQGEILYASARGMLLASAKSTREPKMYHGNSSAFLAKRFMEECLMGQTAVGSFIITAHTPSDMRFHLSKTSEDNAHIATPNQIQTASGREIMDTFERGLELARECLDQYRTRPNLDVFVEAVPLGLSYEFVKALGETARDGDAAIEVIRGEASRPRAQREFVFDAVEAPILDNVAVRFSQAYEPTDVTLTGDVVVLSHVASSEDRVIRLHTDPGSYVNRARVRLNAKQYALALEAHRSDQRIQISGRLEREGNVYWLYAPNDIRIIGETRPGFKTETLF